MNTIIKKREKIQNNTQFLKGIRKHKNIERGVWVNGRSTNGIKNIKIKEMINNSLDADLTQT